MTWTADDTRIAQVRVGDFSFQHWWGVAISPAGASGDRVWPWDKVILAEVWNIRLPQAILLLDTQTALKKSQYCLCKLDWCKYKGENHIKMSNNAILVWQYAHNICNYIYTYVICVASYYLSNFLSFNYCLISLSLWNKLR